MRILIISRTPWNNSNSFGNTFSTLFGGMDEVEIYNICCQAGSIKNNIVKDTLQLSEAYLLKSFRKANVVSQENKPSIEASSVEQMQDFGKKKRSAWMFFARDMIWEITALRWKKLIGGFIASVNPDIIYLPVYASLYMCYIDSYVIKELNKPIVGHISDDVFGYSPEDSRLSLAHYYRYKLRKKIRSIIRKCSYLEVFAENMKEEYEKEFCKTCYSIGKGVSPEQVMQPRLDGWCDEIHFVYTGGIGGERFNTLMMLAESLERHNAEKKCYLDIYSATPLTDNDKEVMSSIKSVVFHGAISGEEVRRVQQDADCLVHVEGFSESSIFKTRMSFSTKIIDYLATGKALLAIGPKEINSIQLLRDKKMAVVVDRIEDLDDTISNMIEERIDLSKIKEAAYNYLITERDIHTIQDGMYKRLLGLVQG